MVDQGTLKSTFKRIGDVARGVVGWTLLWTVVVHGVFVFLFTAACGLFIFGLDFKSVGELAYWVTRYSLTISTPALVVLLTLSKFDEEGFFGWYLFIGYVAGVLIVVLTTIGQLLFRGWLLISKIPQPQIPSPKAGAQGIAILAFAAAVIIGYLVASKTESYMD